MINMAQENATWIGDFPIKTSIGDFAANHVGLPEGRPQDDQHVQGLDVRMQMSSVQNRSLIPLQWLAWCRNPLLDYEIISNI